MARMFALVTLILSLILFPPAALAYLSQDAVLGDKMYPIKRGLEDAILAVASINPWSKAFVATARSARRYREAQALLARGSAEATKTLSELVVQTSSAAEEIQKVGNIEQRKALIAKLSKEIESFDKGLLEVQAKTVVITPQPTPSPIPELAVPSQVPSPVPSPTPIQSGPIPSPVISPVPSPTFIAVAPSPLSSPSPAIAPPSGSPTQTHPIVVSQAEDIEKTRKELEKIKRKLEEESKKHKEEKKPEVKEGKKDEPKEEKERKKINSGRLKDRD